MKFLFRTWVVVTLSVALVVVAIIVWFRFRPEPTGPTPLPIEPGDREIVWLYQATSAAAWERFVTAVKLTEDRLRDELPGIKANIDDRAFPSRSTAVPEVSLTWDGAGGRVVFRWYKLTSDWKARDWVTALLKDRPPPLAIIGGNSSEGGRDLAIHLRAATASLPEDERPLLFLTAATADFVDWPADEPAPDDVDFLPPEADGRPLRVAFNSIYPRRTFRFCFSNRQMSEAVTQFLLSREDLRPDADHVYTVQWKDDAYSRDLVDGFVQSCGRHLNGTVTFNVQEVLSSFGSLDAKNRFEVSCVGRLLDQLQSNGGLPAVPSPDARRKRSLLVVAGQTLPTRRFLRELDRTEPRAARAFVVVTGDALAFNTIYRDRLVTWPIQDLPFSLILFSHANPVAADAGFRPHPVGRTGSETVGDSGPTGTEDVLLFADIIGAAARGSAVRAGPLAGPNRLAERSAARVTSTHAFASETKVLCCLPRTVTARAARGSTSSACCPNSRAAGRWRRLAVRRRGSAPGCRRSRGAASCRGLPSKSGRGARPTRAEFGRSVATPSWCHT